MFCINYPDGALSVWHNDGYSQGVNITWTPLGTIMAAQGFAYNQVLLGDIDGDGRIDYMGIGDNGHISAWRNGGVGTALFWQYLGVVFDGSSMGDPAGFRFVSLRFLYKGQYQR
jgi:hypothetical protein